MKWTHTSYAARCDTCALRWPRLSRKAAEDAARAHAADHPEHEVLVIRSRHEEVEKIGGAA